MSHNPMGLHVPLQGKFLSTHEITLISLTLGGPRCRWKDNRVNPPNPDQLEGPSGLSDNPD
jgi:hypothetical protein